jgi:hypothetical protein
MRPYFVPNGHTDDLAIPRVRSVVDWVARRLAIDWLPYEIRAAAGIFTVDERVSAAGDWLAAEAAKITAVQTHEQYKLVIRADLAGLAPLGLAVRGRTCPPSRPSAGDRTPGLTCTESRYARFISVSYSIPRVVSDTHWAVPYSVSVARAGSDCGGPAGSHSPSD